MFGVLNALRGDKWERTQRERLIGNDLLSKIFSRSTV